MAITAASPTDTSLTMQNQDKKRRRSMENRGDVTISHELKLLRAKYTALEISHERTLDRHEQDSKLAEDKVLNMRRTMKFLDAELLKTKDEVEDQRVSTAQTQATLSQTITTLNSRVATLERENLVLMEQHHALQARLQHDTQQLTRELEASDRELDALHTSYQDSTVSEGKMSQADLAVLEAELNVSRLAHADALHALTEADEMVSQAAELKQLRQEASDWATTTRTQANALQRLREAATHTIVSDEKLAAVTQELRRAQAAVDASAEKEASYAPLLADTQQWILFFSQFGTSYPDIVLLSKTSMVQASVALHQKLQQQQLEALEQQGQLETRVALLNKKLRETAKEVLVETQKCRELNDQLSDQAHVLQRSENQRAYLEKKVTTLTTFMDTYDKETRREEVMTRVNDNDGTLAALTPYRLKITQLDTELVAATARIDQLQATVAASPLPSSTAAMRRVASLERELETSQEEVHGLMCRVAKGEYNPAATKVLRLASAEPLSAYDMETLSELRAENTVLKTSLAETHHSNKGSDTTGTSAASASSHDLRHQRLMEVFKAQFKKYQNAVTLLTGYTIVLKTDQAAGTIVTLKSVYAEAEQDEIQFQMSSRGDKLDLLETDFCKNLDKRVFTVLNICRSIPAFISTLTLHLFESVTFQG